MIRFTLNKRSKLQKGQDFPEENLMTTGNGWCYEVENENEVFHKYSEKIKVTMRK